MLTEIYPPELTGTLWVTAAKSTLQRILEGGDEAIKWQKKALALAPDDQKDDFRQRLDLYEAGKPYRQQAK